MSEHSEEVKVHQSKLARWLFFLLGTIFVAIGILGVFLPLLPTTIFLLLAAWCYAQSSERYYHWLHHNRFFGKYLRNYSLKKGMTLPSKIFSLALLWAGISFSAFYATEKLYVKIILFAIALGVTIHLVTIKTVKDID